jgi:hypothetical protein
MEKMVCQERINGRECGGNMIPGSIMAPVWGRLDGGKIERGCTLNMVSAVHEVCMKCENCGHSVIFKDIYM